jgi:hypothetical protein
VKHFVGILNCNREEKFEKFSGKICLNINSRTDKEFYKRGDIVLLAEIITNLRYWRPKISNPAN